MTPAPAVPVVDGQFCEVGEGIRLHYASAGQPGQPLLLFVHGFPEFWGAWADLLPRFGERWFAVAPDLRGYNLSDKPSDPQAYRPAALIGDLSALITRLGYQRATVVAHDWGGALAWGLAIAQPARVERLVSINSPHPYAFWQALCTDAEQQSASRYMNFLRQPGSEQALLADGCAMLRRMLDGFGGRSWLTGDTLARYLAAWQQPGAMRAGVEYYRASPLYPPTDDDPGARRVTMQPADFTVRVPTLVLWGEGDRALRPVLLDRLPELVPDLRIERFPQASHWIVHEVPDDVVAAIGRFIDPMSPGR